MKTTQKRPTLVMGAIGLCVWVLACAPAVAQAGSQCSASAVFTGCAAKCSAGAEASCQEDYSLFRVSCTCDGWRTGTSLSLNSQYQAQFLAYIDLLNSLGSPEATRVADAAQGILDAVAAGDVAMYDAFVAEHTQAYGAMSDHEQDVVFGFFGSFLEGLVDFFEGVWDWIKDRFGDLWEFLKDLPAWILERIRDGDIEIEPWDADGDGTPDGVIFRGGIPFGPGGSP